MWERIKSEDGDLIAIIVRSSFKPEGVNFLSDETFPLQLGISSYKKNSKITPHVHLNKTVLIQEIQEIVHIEQGRTIVNLYDKNEQQMASLELSMGDTIFFVNGGHGFEMLEDTQLLEVKQGPYNGKEKDKRLLK